MSILLHYLTSNPFSPLCSSSSSSSSDVVTATAVEIQNLPGFKILNEENYESQGGSSAGTKRKGPKKRVSVEKQRAEESLESQALEQVQTLPAQTAG